ncbi:MAG: hypothetical protein IJA94_02620 [Bacilli bacterium]|nr:hypothetical protein [Bacilli bacterium]
MEKLYNEIYKVVWDYENQSKEIDIHFVEKIKEIYVTYNSLSNYVKRIFFGHIDGKIVAKYNSLNSSITVDIERWYSYYNNIVKLYNINEPFYKYLLFVRIIVHELEHANQRNTAWHKEGIESDIIFNTDYLYYVFSDKIKDEDIKQAFIRQKQVYFKYYNYCPVERLAEYSSNLLCEKCANIYANETGNHIQKIEDYFGFKRLSVLADAYLKMDFPTKFYMEQLGTGDCYPMIESQAEKLSLVDKARYGFPLCDEEKNYLVEQKEIIRARLQ